MTILRMTVFLLAGVLSVVPACAVELQMLLPLGRVAYQTNEQIDISVLRADAEALPASTLALTVAGEDGSTLDFTFPLAAAPVVGAEARATEHLHLNGWLLRPGKYTVTAAAYGATAQKSIEVYSHLRKTTFKLIDWGSRAKAEEMTALGENSMGFNLMYAGGWGDHSIRGGMDFSGCCIMGGGHQMDLRMECDWSDPHVLPGAQARVSRAALNFRTKPNAIGVHFYDEPGLTWWKHPKTGELTPHNIPTQDASYKGAFGSDPLQYFAVKADDPDSVAKWAHWSRWKLSFMEAAWKYTSYGVTQVRPDLLSYTQSAYGWNAFADGYYFNIVRALPVISGHGGYDDLGWGYWTPAFTFEFGRARDLNKPNWYLPAWYSSTPADRYRMEQYMSFMMNLQGMAKPPDMHVHSPSTSITAQGVVESNKLMGQLGTIFQTMPVTRPDTAILYAMSQCIDAQIKSGMTDNYTGGGHMQRLGLVYLAGKTIQTALFPIVEEDVLDGTLATHHKAVVLTGINYLDPKVARALEAYAANGGAVLLTDDCQVQLTGASKLGVAADLAYFDRISALYKANKMEEMRKLSTVGHLYQVAAPVAKALKAKLTALGIAPDVAIDNPEVAGSRQAYGDIEYLFTVNGASDLQGDDKNAIKPAVATLTLPADGRPVYDAIYGGPATLFTEKGKALVAQVRFGPGQLRVFARTARPIGGVQVGTPSLFRDYTAAQAPVHLTFGARLVDPQGLVIAGSAPLEILLTDPLGAVRYDLYRATDQGALQLTLPLAVNDPAGAWTLTVRELLNNTQGSVQFTYTPPQQCGALAGATPRATYFGNDREQIFRFFRTHQDVTLVTGSSDYDTAAAARLAESLKPWGVRCTTVTAAEVNKPRTLSDDEAKTWVGLSGGTKKAADAHIANVGFAVNGPVVLLGNPDDNPLIGAAQKWDFLPYAPKRDEFPGRGHGYLAWQRDAISYGAESITCIAYDAVGMSEAVGTLYEAVAGLDPLTPLVLPTTAKVTAATQAPQTAPAPQTAWQSVLPDGIVSLKALPGGALAILAKDGSLTNVDAAGKTRWQVTFPAGERWTALDAAADGGVIALGASRHVLCYDGNGKLLFDKTLAETNPVIASVTVAPNGKSIAVAGLDGQLGLFSLKGKRLWITGGVSKAALTKWEADTKAWQDAVKVADEAVKAWENEVKAWEATQAAARGKKPERPRRPAQPVKPVPDPYLAAAFSTDGKTLYACTKTELHALKAGSGAKEKVIGPADASQSVAVVGDTLLYADGTGKLRQLSLTTGALTGQVTLPGQKARALGLAATGEGITFAAEADGVLRSLQGLNGPIDDQTSWSAALPGYIVKFTATRNGLTAVAYWGGLLKVYDATGKAVSAQMLPQDATALAWHGDLLMAGLADGRLLALTVK